MAITLNSNKILQNLRNNVVFDTKETAKQALTALATSLTAEHDGSISLARYTDGGTTKSLIGAYHHANKSMTIYDPDASAAEVAALEAKLAAEVAARKAVDGVDADTYTPNQLTEYLKEAASLKDADEKLDTAIKANADAIKALNGTHDATVTEGNYVSGVHFNGGVLTVNEKALVDAQDKVLEQKGGSVKSTISLVKVTEGLATNVREAYKLVGKDGVNALGDTINVYKDSSLKSVTLEGTEGKKQELVFTYITVDGNEDVVRLDVSKFLAESEFKNGLQVVGGEVSVLVDTTNDEGYLTVSEKGVKVSGINAKLNAAKVVVNPKADGHVTVKVVNNPTTGDVVTIEENDIASAQGLASEIGTRTSEISRVEGLINDEKKRAEGVESTLTTNLAAEVAARKAVDGQTGQTYVANTADTVTYIKDAQNLNDADIKLDAAIKAEVVRASAAEQANTAAIKAEETRALAAEKVNADAITKLDGEVVKTLTAGHGIEVTDGAANEKTVAIKLDSVKGNNVLTNGTDGLYLGNVWDCGTFDFTV